MRKAEWGNWGITLWDESIKGVFLVLDFPVGPQGPRDGHIGSKQREHYKSIVRDWVERGIEPAGTRLQVIA